MKDPDFDRPPRQPIIGTASVAIICGTVLALAGLAVVGVIGHADPAMGYQAIETTGQAAGFTTCVIAMLVFLHGKI